MGQHVYRSASEVIRKPLFFHHTPDITCHFLHRAFQCVKRAQHCNADIAVIGNLSLGSGGFNSQLQGGVGLFSERASERIGWIPRLEARQRPVSSKIEHWRWVLLDDEANKFTDFSLRVFIHVESARIKIWVLREKLQHEPEKCFPKSIQENGR